MWQTSYELQYTGSIREEDYVYEGLSQKIGQIATEYSFLGGQREYLLAEMQYDSGKSSFLQIWGTESAYRFGKNRCSVSQIPQGRMALE